MNNIRVPEGQTLGADRDITDEAKDRDLLALMAAILLSGDPPPEISRKSLRT
jgi:hypothetical protein